MFYEKIIAVDDDIRSLESLRLIFRNQYEVICFRNGSEALAYLSKPNDIRLAFVDVFMKEMDGMSVLQAMKNINKDILVVIMTGFGTKEVMLQALQNHADDFVEKPLEMGELKEKVKNLLNRKFTARLEKMQTAQQIKYFVEKNCMGVTLKDVSDEICLSQKYISRLFKEKNQCCFRDFKIKMKIDKAKDWLKNYYYPIYRIAEMLGYQNAETFMRLFKRKTGLTPLQYRERNSKNK